MKILVLAKHVPDTEAVIKIASDGKALDKSEFKYMLDPCSEYAVEEAVRTQEKFKGESVVVSLGQLSGQDVIRKALAMGIDRAVWIETTDVEEQSLDSFAISSALSKVILEEKPDVIFAGLSTTDGGSGNTGPMVAELYGVPSLINVSKINWSADGKTCECEREVEGGIVEVYEVTLPCLIAPHQGLNQPRFPALQGIMKAKKKPLVLKKLAEVFSGKQQVQVPEYKLPPEKQPGKIFKGEPVEAMVAKVVGLLRSEAKVI